MNRISRNIIPFFIVAFLLPLFSFPVLAEEYSPEDVDWSIRPTAIVDNDFIWTFALTCEQFEIFDEWRQTVNISSSAGFYYSAIDCLYVFTSISNFEYGALTGSGYTLDFNSDGSLKEIKSYSGTFYPSDSSVDAQWSEWTSAVFPGINDPDKVRLSQYLSHYNSSCTVTPSPTPTPTPTPTPDVSACPADSLNVFANPLILSLVRSAINGGFSDWYISSVSQESGGFISASASECSHLDPFGFRHGYRLTYLSSSGEYLYEYQWITQKTGLNIQYINGTGCIVNEDLSWTTISFDTILTKACYDELVLKGEAPLEVNDSKGNALIENGNSSSQNASNALNDTTSDLNDIATDFEQFEAQFNSNLTSSLNRIDVNQVDFGSNADFSKTALWVKLRFDELVESSSIFGQVLTFSLIIGLFMLLVGRGGKE